MSTGAQIGREPAVRRWPALLLAIALPASLAVVFYPAWIIQPFRAQRAGDLLLALRMLRLAPAVTLIALGAGLLAVIRMWRQGWLRRLGLSAAVVLLAGLAALARIDYFEIMFHPDPAPHFVSAAQAGVDADDMVLAVHVGREARAYPVRLMAYHHLVNDVVAGVPLLPTY